MKTRKLYTYIFMAFLMTILSGCQNTNSQTLYKKPNVNFLIDASYFSENPYYPDGKESGLLEESEETVFVKLDKKDLSMTISVSNLLRPFIYQDRENGDLTLDELRELNFGQYLRYIKDTPWAYTIDPLKDGGYLICLWTIHKNENNNRFDFRMIDCLSFYGFADEKIADTFSVGDSYAELIKAFSGSYYWNGNSLLIFEDGRMLSVVSEFNKKTDTMEITSIDFLGENECFSVLFLLSDNDYSALCTSVMENKLTNPEATVLLAMLEKSSQDSLLISQQDFDPAEYASNCYIPKGDDEDLPRQSAELDFLKQAPVNIAESDYDAVNWCIAPIGTVHEQRFTYAQMEGCKLGRYINYIEGTPWCYTIDKLEDNNYLLCLFIISERKEGKCLQVIDAMIFVDFPDKEDFEELKEGISIDKVKALDPSAYFDDTVSVHRFQDGGMLEIRYKNDQQGMMVIDYLKYRIDGYSNISVLNFLTDTDYEAVTGKRPYP